MRCPYCGQEHRSDINYCPKTGKPLAGAPSVAQPEIPPPVPSAAEQVCPGCGKSVKAGWAHCVYCGMPLTPAVQPGDAQKKKRNLALIALLSLLVLLGLTAAGLAFLKSPASRPTKIAGEKGTSKSTFTTSGIFLDSSTPSSFAAPVDNKPKNEPTPTASVPGSTPIPATDVPTIEPFPTNSPSLTATSEKTEPGGRIVFSCNDSDGYAQICMIKPDGSNEQQLTSFSAAASTYASLSSDGSTLIFTSNKTGDHAIYEMNIGSRQLIQITQQGGDKTNPRLSPDGRYITYTDVRNKTTNIYVINRDGAGLREIYTKGSVAVWSPDGSKFAFICSDENSSLQICIMNADGSNVQKITDMADINESVNWSSDGSLITFSIGKKEEKNRKICIISPNGSGFTILYDSSDAINPAFSPDGKWIVFINYLDKNKSGRGEVFIMRKDGSDLRRLTNNDRNDWLPYWGN